MNNKVCFWEILRGDNMRNRLKGLIISRGYKLTDFCKVVGIPQNTLYRKMRGDANFNEKEIEIICNVLKVKPEEIFFENLVTK
jgi:predicted transcriptional regulator